MKNTVKLTAAAMAAIMAMSCAAFSSSAIYTGEDVDYADGEMHIMSVAVGGWEVNADSNISLSANPEAKAAFEKAAKSVEGYSCKAIALLGTQVVAGTNYAVLCRMDGLDTDGGATEIRIMYIYEDLQGNCEITGFQTLIGKQLMGGYTANDGLLGIKKNKDVYKAFRKAMKDLDGVSYTPVAYLGSQVVAGTNYMILCRSRVVYPGAPCKWSLVTVYKDLKGNVSLGDIETLDLGHAYIDGETNDMEEEDIMTGIANPWAQYDTVEAAAKAAGVEFTAPGNLRSHKLTYIQAMNGLVDLRYIKEGNEICVRKGAGTDDVSGDYNTYENVTGKKINGNTVTLKSNGKGVRAAVWTDGKNAFSVFSENALTEEFMESIISTISK